MPLTTPLPGIELIDLALYIKAQQILILTDLHIGIEESLVKQGVLIPKFHFKDLVDKIEKIFSLLKKQKKPVKLIIINGDLKHEFGSISDEEWRNTIKLIDFLSRKCEKLILVKGNHDKILGPIAEKKKILFVDQFICDALLVCHGDVLPDPIPSVKTIIIGHDHPAVSIKDSLKSELFKCFLIGKYKNKNLIVQPSLNPITEGTDLTKEKPLSPFLHQDLNKFDVYVVADKIYNFKKILQI
jgi:putative SbcD/Mre11-related phosphoesterase